MVSFLDKYIDDVEEQIDENDKLFCKIRNNKVSSNPEEITRIAFLNYLTEKLKILKDEIKVELKRLDISLWNKDFFELQFLTAPYLIIEMKRYDYPFNGFESYEFNFTDIDEALNQLIGYLNNRKCNYGILTNGEELYTVNIKNKEPIINIIGGPDLSNKLIKFIDEAKTENYNNYKNIVDSLKKAKNGNKDEFQKIINLVKGNGNVSFRVFIDDRGVPESIRATQINLSNYSKIKLISVSGL